MLASERTRYIVSQLHKSGIVNLKDIARELNISEATVRRDFEKLENEGKLKRVTGGATLSEEAATVELTMDAKKYVNYDGKLRVARRASEFVKDGECIYLDGGTSVAAMADFLAKRKIRIVTNSDLVLRKLSNATAEIILIGGNYLPHYSMSVGSLTQEMLSKFYFDKAFISCTCTDIGIDTVFTNEIDTLIIKQIAMKNSGESYLLLDSSKISRRSFCRLGPLSGFKRVICDSIPELQKVPANFELV